MRSLCHILAMLVVACIDLSGQSLSKKFTRQQLQEDFTQLSGELRYGHPGWNLHINARQFDSASAALYRQIDRDMRLVDFYRIATQLTAAIRCGHTAIRLSPAMRTQVNIELKVFPYEVAIIDGKVFISSQATGQDL